MLKDIFSSQTQPTGSGAAGPKQIFISDLRPKDTVRTTFLVRSKELIQAKNGKPYLALVLGDRTGAIDTRVWEDAAALSESFREGDVVAVSGKTHLFQNRLQLVLEHLVPIPENEFSLGDYLPVSPADLDEMYAQMLQIFRDLPNPWVRDLGLALLEDPEIQSRYRKCPAAKTIHHAFVGGLLCHSLQIIRLADAVLPLYKGINRDLVVFGAAFHDFGKIFELSYDGSFGYTDEGRLVGHIAIGVTLIDRKIRLMPGFPEDLEWQLKHLVLSHHGRLEYGSPKRPHTLEAQLVHHLDDMDSKINSIQTFIASENSGSRWTGHHKAYDQYYYRGEPAT